MTNYIVGVCTGNSGRSPVFELAGNNHLEDIGADDRLMVVSAGTLVDVIKKGEYSIESMKKFIDQARQRGDIYTPSEEARLDEAVATGDLKTARLLFKHLVETFHTEEVSHRTAAIRHFGIKNDDTLRKLSYQFNPIDSYFDRAAVITMDARNKGVVEKMYDDAKLQRPYVEVLNQVPGNVGKLLNADAFGKTRQEYFTVFEQILQQTPAAIDYVLEHVTRR